MPKATQMSSSSGRKHNRHNPLEADILATGNLKLKPSKSKGKDDDDKANFVDSKASKQILRLGRELADEDAQRVAAENPAINAVKSAFDADTARQFGFGDEEEEKQFENETFGDDDEVQEEYGGEIEVDDLETFNKFLPSGADDNPLAGWAAGGERENTQTEGQGTNLADLILRKIAEREAGMGGREPMADAVDEDYELPPKVIEVYTQIGMILSRYKSGPLPKVFKILPTVPHWEEILMVTSPDSWSPNAVYAATRLFASGKPLVAQRFFEMVLLDKVREDIHETKKLNVHLFNSLKKGLYKPSAWFKGILFPLVGSGTCTLREAQIISAVLQRVSIPVLHSAAALKGLCDIAAQEVSQGNEAGGATNIFLKTLIEKGYALPWQVVDSLVFHFLRFRQVDPNSVREGARSAATMKSLPVIWHQSLLAFAQRYRNDITEDQREALLDLLLSHGHSAIGPEVRRELLAGRGRGVPLEEAGPAFDGDDTMQVD
ncbi:Bystin-domain-containing protein [Coniochaeta sp. 2T2.1]|nr:Bystin-domain-containing protein [Coniochaeta sp. 2T2.1]